MARQIVHDDDVARPQLRYENLRDIGFEPVTVDRTVQHHRRDHATHAEARDERGGLAMAMRVSHPQPLASGTTAVTAGHVGGGPRLVDKHQAFRLQIDLVLEPVVALPQDVGAVLLDGMPSLFLRVMPRRAKKRCSPATDTVRPASAKAMRSSSSEMSLRASHKARISAARSSTRRDRMSPPCGLGAKAPVSRRCACQRMAVDGATPKRAAAPRQLSPPSIAARSRVRKSIDRG